MLRTFTKRYGPMFAQPGQRLGHSGPSWSQTGDAGNIVAQNHGFQDNTTSGKEKTKPREKTRTKTRQNKNTREQTHRMYLDRDTTEQRKHKKGNARTDESQQTKLLRHTRYYGVPKNQKRRAHLDHSPHKRPKTRSIPGPLHTKDPKRRAYRHHPRTRKTFCENSQKVAGTPLHTPS